jgi:hypothetical protein
MREAGDRGPGRPKIEARLPGGKQSLHEDNNDSGDGDTATINEFLVAIVALEGEGLSRVGAGVS